MPTPQSVRSSNPRFNARGMQQHALEDVVVTAQVNASHPSGFVEMRKRSFQPFASQPQQTFPPRPANAPAVAIDGVTRLGVVLSSYDARDPVPRCNSARRPLRDPPVTWLL